MWAQLSGSSESAAEKRVLITWAMETDGGGARDPLQCVLRFPGTGCGRVRPASAWIDPEAGMEGDRQVDEETSGHSQSGRL
jgi:hypothetical protein